MSHRSDLQQLPATNVTTPTSKQVPESAEAAKKKKTSGENVPIKKARLYKLELTATII